MKRKNKLKFDDVFSIDTTWLNHLKRSLKEEINDTLQNKKNNAKNDRIQRDKI